MLVDDGCTVCACRYQCVSKLPEEWQLTLSVVWQICKWGIRNECRGAQSTVSGSSASGPGAASSVLWPSCDCPTWCVCAMQATGVYVPCKLLVCMCYWCVCAMQATGVYVSCKLLCATLVSRATEQSTHSHSRPCTVGRLHRCGQQID